MPSLMFSAILRLSLCSGGACGQNSSKIWVHLLGKQDTGTTCSMIQFEGLHTLHGWAVNCPAFTAL